MNLKHGSFNVRFQCSVLYITHKTNIMTDWKEKHDRYVREALTNAGFNVDSLTEEQKDLIMQPEDAPENFYCDGEISPRQAVAYWKQKLNNSGLSKEDVARAVKMQLG